MSELKERLTQYLFSFWSNNELSWTVDGDVKLSLHCLTWPKTNKLGPSSSCFLLNESQNELFALLLAFWGIRRSKYCLRLLYHLFLPSYSDWTRRIVENAWAGALSRLVTCAPNVTHGLKLRFRKGPPALGMKVPILYCTARWGQEKWKQIPCWLVLIEFV